MMIPRTNEEFSRACRASWLAPFLDISLLHLQV